MKKVKSKIRVLREIESKLKRITDYIFINRCCYCGGKDNFSLITTLNNTKEDYSVVRCSICGKKNKIRVEGNNFAFRPYDIDTQKEEE
jgi:transcription elongation factor Elf1